MATRTLPPELVSLVHHIELRNSGWWDSAIERFVVATIWLSGENLTIDGLVSKLHETFHITLTPDRVEAHISALLSSDTLISLSDGRLKISEASLVQFHQGLKENEVLDGQAQFKFITMLGTCCPSLPPEETWKSFNEELLLPLIYEMGARTYELLSGDIRWTPSSGQR